MDSATLPSAPRRMTKKGVSIEILNSTLECNFISKQEGCDSVESAHFNHVKKSGTDENLELAHPNRTLSDLSNLKSQKINPMEILKR